jgi:hypothetical protein
VSEWVVVDGVEQCWGPGPRCPVCCEFDEAVVARVFGWLVGFVR